MVGSQEHYRVFISHSHGDSQWARRVQRYLERHRPPKQLRVAEAAERAVARIELLLRETDSQLTQRPDDPDWLLLQRRDPDLGRVHVPTLLLLGQRQQAEPELAELLTAGYRHPELMQALADSGIEP